MNPFKMNDQTAWLLGMWINLIELAAPIALLVVPITVYLLSKAREPNDRVRRTWVSLALVVAVVFLAGIGKLCLSAYYTAKPRVPQRATVPAKADGTMTTGPYVLTVSN